MNFFFRLLAIPLAIIVLASCDSVNTDQAEESTLDQYQRTYTGTFPAQVHVQNYWNSKQQISCTNENPATLSFYNLNPPGVKGYFFDTIKDISTSNLDWLEIAAVKVGEDYQVTGWTIPGSVDEVYTIHSWLKNTFSKEVYAGETVLYYDKTPPIFSSVIGSSSKTPTIILTIQDLTLDEDTISVTTGTHTLTDAGIPCSGVIQLSEDNFLSCIPFVSQPEFEKDNTDKFKNTVKIQAPELPESTEFAIKIEGGISDCPGNLNNAIQIQKFVTADTGPPYIVSASLKSNNSYDTSLAKPGDSIILTFISNERLSETGATDPVGTLHPKNSPKVDFWVNNSSTFKTVNATKVTSDLSGRTWTATILVDNNTSPWDENTSISGDRINYRIRDYWDLAKNANLDFNPNKGADNITSTSDGSFIIYDNMIPKAVSSLTLLTSNSNFSNMFKVGEKAFITFDVNEFVYTPDVNIGGFANTTVTGGPTNWYAEYTYNDNNTPNNDNVTASIIIKDKVGNINNLTSDNSVIFDKEIRTLNPVTIISDNPVRKINQSGQIHHYAKKNDNITLEFKSDETIIVNYVTIIIDNVSDNVSNSNITALDSPLNTSWKVVHQMTHDNVSDGVVAKILINFTDQVNNPAYTVDLTTDSSIIIYDNTPPKLNDVTIISNNSNNSMAKKNDTVTLNFKASEKLKNSTIQCYTGSVTSNTSASCGNSLVHIYGDDNITTQVTPIQLTGSDFSHYTSSRVFSTASPRTAQSGDNVTFRIEFEDYAGNQGQIISSTTDNTSVTYDDRVPFISSMTINSDNINSSSENFNKLSMPGDNITVSFITTESLGNLIMELTNEIVSPTLSGDNYTITKKMLQSDTTKAFNLCANRITGCQIPFQINAKDLAGNETILNQDNTTNNSTVKFDGIKPVLTSVKFKSNGCNVFGAKTGDNATLTVSSNEPIFSDISSLNKTKVFLDNGSDNLSVTNLIEYSGTNGDLVSNDEFSVSYKFENGHEQGLIGFYINYVDPAGNKNLWTYQNNNTTDGSNITFDSIEPDLDNITIYSNNLYTAYAKSSDTIYIEFDSNEKLMHDNDVGLTVSSTCHSPLVTRNYCKSGLCQDNSTNSTLLDNSNQRLKWKDTRSYASSNKTNQAGDNVSFKIIYYDWVGNRGVDVTTTTDNTSVVYDDVIPTIQYVNIKSNNQNNPNKYAIVGDNVTLTLISPETLRNKPEIKLSKINGGTDVSYDTLIDNLSDPSGTSFSLIGNIVILNADNDTTWIATRTMTASDDDYPSSLKSIWEETQNTQIDTTKNTRYGDSGYWPLGAMHKNIKLTDLAGNIFTTSSTTDNSSITFDKTPPSLKIKFQSSNCNKRAAKVGDNGTLMLYSNEPIKKPTIKIYDFTKNPTNWGAFQNSITEYPSASNFASASNPKTIIFNSNYDNNSRRNWKAVHEFGNSDQEIRVPFLITYSDPAGNTGSDNTTNNLHSPDSGEAFNWYDNSSITFDKTRPELNYVTLTSANDNASYSSYADTQTYVYVNFTSNERLRHHIDQGCGTGKNNADIGCCFSPKVIRKYTTGGSEQITGYDKYDSLQKNPPDTLHANAHAQNLNGSNPTLHFVGGKLTYPNYVEDSNKCDISAPDDWSNSCGVQWVNWGDQTSIGDSSQAGDNFTFKIIYWDWAGNIGIDNVTSTTDNSSIIFDDKLPKNPFVSVKSDNWNINADNDSSDSVKAYVAKEGDNITLTFKLINEPLQIFPPKVKVAKSTSWNAGNSNSPHSNHCIGCKEYIPEYSTDNSTWTQYTPSSSITWEDNVIWRVVHTVTSSDTDGQFEFQITSEDLSGNTWTVREGCQNCGSISSFQDITDTNHLFGFNQYNGTNIHPHAVGTTTDQSTVIIDKTPPLVCSRPTANYGNVPLRTGYCNADSCKGNDYSLITYNPDNGDNSDLAFDKDTRIILALNDITGPLKTTSGSYTGKNNLSTNANSNPTYSSSNCSGTVKLTDNRSNYDNCSSLLDKFSENSYFVERTKNWKEIDNAYTHNNCDADILDSTLTNGYTEQYYLDPVEFNNNNQDCPIRPSTQCKASLWPNTIYKVIFDTELSDLAGNIHKPDNATINYPRGHLPGDFRTLDRPKITATSLSDNPEKGYQNGYSVDNISYYQNPTFTFGTNSNNNISDNNPVTFPRAMNHINIINKMNQTHQCFTPNGGTGEWFDNNDITLTSAGYGDSGTISLSPSPNDKYVWIYRNQDGSQSDELTIYPLNKLNPNTTYTVTLTDDICRTDDNINLEQYKITFKTDVNGDSILVAHFPVDGNFNDSATSDGSDILTPQSGGFSDTNDRNNVTNQAYQFGSNKKMDLSLNDQLTKDSTVFSLWYKEPITEPATLFSSSQFNIKIVSGNKLNLSGNCGSGTTDKLNTNDVWHHVVLYIGNGYCKLYFDGEETLNRTNSISSDLNGLNLVIGDAVSGSIEAIDEIKVMTGEGITEDIVKDLYIDSNRKLEGLYLMGDSGGVDTSGKNRNGTSSGSIFQQVGWNGVSLGASKFDGSAYLTVPSNSNMDKFTIIMWVSPDENEQAAGILSSSNISGNDWTSKNGFGIYSWIYGYDRLNSYGNWRNQNNTKHRWEMWLHPQTLHRENYVNIAPNSGSSYEIRQNEVNAQIDTSSNMVYQFNSQWHLLVATYGGSRKYNYINGEKSSILTINDFSILKEYTGSKPSADYIRTNNNIIIGKGAIGGGFKGLIDNVRIYSRVLTEREIEIYSTLND